MGWEKPAGYVPPDEQRAAEEAAAEFEKRRELADRQSSRLADAIHDGFAMVAAAIVAASDHPIGFAIERYNVARFGPDEAEDTPRSDLERFELERRASPQPADDGIDEILDDPPHDGEPRVLTCTCGPVLADGLVPYDSGCPVHGPT